MLNVLFGIIKIMVTIFIMIIIMIGGVHQKMNFNLKMIIDIIKITNGSEIKIGGGKFTDIFLNFFRINSIKAAYF